MVSILLPVYNVAEYLPKCIESILSQTYYNLQIVLIDDGSQDDSWSICQKYAKQDKRIEIYHQKNQGVATVRNKLLSYAKGEYTLFVDSDDWIEPKMVETLLNLAKCHKADITICNNVINDNRFNAESNSIKIWSQEQAIFYFLQHIIIRGSLCNKMIRTVLIQNEKFDQDISYGEDALMCWILLQKVKKVIFTNQPLYHYRMNDKSLSHEVFGEKKMTAYNVWERISTETQMLWPQFQDIANATFCVEMTILLYDATVAHYKKDKSIQQLQNVLKKYAYLILKTKRSSWKMFLFAFLGGKSYKILGLITRYISQ